MPQILFNAKTKALTLAIAICLGSFSIESQASMRLVVPLGLASDVGGTEGLRLDLLSGVLPEGEVGEPYHYSFYENLRLFNKSGEEESPPLTVDWNLAGTLPDNLDFDVFT